METTLKIMGDEAAVTAAVIFDEQQKEDEDSVQLMTNAKQVSFTTRDNPAQGSTEGGGGDHAAHQGEGDHPIDGNNGVGADTSHPHPHHDNHHHHHRHAHRSLSDQMPWYTPPIQRQRWGEEQLPHHTEWGDIFFDLFYVASACKYDICSSVHLRK
jgi:hypothetical protein